MHHDSDTPADPVAVTFTAWPDGRLTMPDGDGDAWTVAAWQPGDPATIAVNVAALGSAVDHALTATPAPASPCPHCGRPLAPSFTSAHATAPRTRS